MLAATYRKKNLETETQPVGLSPVSGHFHTSVTEEQLAHLWSLHCPKGAMLPVCRLRILLPPGESPRISGFWSHWGFVWSLSHLSGPGLLHLLGRFNDITSDCKKNSGWVPQSLLRCHRGSDMAVGLLLLATAGDLSPKEWLGHQSRL